MRPQNEDKKFLMMDDDSCSDVDELIYQPSKTGGCSLAGAAY